MQSKLETKKKAKESQILEGPLKRDYLAFLFVWNANCI
jgi:hypothetical protein